jgi:predicted phosphodiesterase
MRTIAPGVLTRRRFLKFLAAGGAACLGAGRAPGAAETPPDAKPAFRFAVLADVQYADIATEGKRQYRESLLKLEHAVEQIGGLKPDFVIQLGDFINGGFANFDPVLAAYAKLTVPAYHVLGNHDFAVEADNRGKVLAKLGLDKLGGGQGYYDFARTGWRLVVLNGNDLSVIARSPDSPEGKAAAALMMDLRKKGAPNAAAWNGAVGPQQLDWLKKVLGRAAAAGERSIVFCHFPVYPPGRSNLWNDTQVVEALESAKGVVAYIAGHEHQGGYAQKGGIHFLTLKGLVEADPTAYALIEVFPDCLKVTGFGREPSRTLNI